MKVKSLVIAAVAGLVLLGFAAPAGAEQGDMRFQFGALYNFSTDELSTSDETLEVDDTAGFQVSFEYMVSDLIGIEPMFSSGSQDVLVTGSALPDFTLGEIDSDTLCTHVNFHLLRERAVDLYLGPTLGYTFWGDFRSPTFPDSFPADDKFIYGVNLGLDVPFGESRWSFSGAMNYLVSEITLEGSADEPDLGFDPLQFRAGVSYRF